MTRCKIPYENAVEKIDMECHVGSESSRPLGCYRLEKSYKKEELPALSTMRELLDKMGYRLRRVQKTKPQKNSRNG